MTTSFDDLPHEEQLKHLQNLAGAALAHYDLPDGATSVDDPTLEESYIAFMATRGRSAVALEDQGEAA